MIQFLLLCDNALNHPKSNGDQYGNYIEKLNIRFLGSRGFSRHCFNQNRSSVGNCHCSRFRHCLINSQRIITVHTNLWTGECAAQRFTMCYCFHAVTRASGSNAVTTKLITNRRGNSKAVVATEEQCWTLHKTLSKKSLIAAMGYFQSRGHIEGSMKITLGSCALTKITHHH